MGDECRFLHEKDTERMPVCREFKKYSKCNDPDCIFKHGFDNVKECNMYKFGFCIFGKTCRFNHKNLSAPPPEPRKLKAKCFFMWNDNFLKTQNNRNLKGKTSKIP